MNGKWLLTQHNKKFISWFNKKTSNDDSASEIIKWLSYMPKLNVMTWTTYDISNFFHTKVKDDRSTMQNSKVMVGAKSMYFSSLKDKNPILATSVFYGVIDEILELIMLFSKCLYL